jgi:hypothetical protein
MNENKEKIEKLNTILERFKENKSIIYFLTYDTKNNARASVKYIYDLAKTLNENSIKAKLLVEDKTYTGVSGWLGDEYNDIEIVSMKDDKITINLDDMVVVPEYYTNSLEQLAGINCIKVMLIQQRSYIFENLQLGQKWSNYGFDMVITTTESTKKYILDYFPESLVFIIPPIISDIFKKSDKPQKPFIAISCRDRIKHKKIISEFYLKYPQLRWVNFKDMVQLTYEEFANSLKECMVSVWVDEDSTFGTFPLESMKCEVPVIGKIPNIEPDWLNENGIWTYDVEKITELLGTYVLANIDGAEITDEVKQKFKDTLLPYDENITKNSITSIFTTLRNKRIESINILIQNLTKEK